jgi:N-methylhydantoinase B
VLEPLQGGSGGRPGKDGIDGVNFSGGALRNAPIEALELDCPIFVTGYRLNDAVAPGKWRGGSGILLEFQLLSPHAQVSSRGWDRFHFRPWGRAGGAGGTPGRTYLIDADGTARAIPKIEVLRLAPGQTVRIVSPGGGGFGSPLERDPAAVVLDVEDGFVAVDEALAKYGVVIRGGKVDAEATALARKSAAKQGKPGAFFNFGAERAAYEEQLPQGFQDMVVEILSRQPISSRQHLRVTIYDYALNAKGGLPSRTDIEALIASLTDEARKPVLRWVNLAAVA